MVAKQGFSKRYGYDPTVPSEPIAEDAPQWLRKDYFSTVLSKLLYTDQDSRSPNKEQRPLGVKQLHEDFCIRIRAEMDERAYDSWYAHDELHDRLMGVEWYHFYDFVELVAAELNDAENRHAFDDEWVSKFGLEVYRRDVNSLFADSKVVWRLDRQGELTRENAKVLAERAGAVRDSLDTRFIAARAHYAKAHRFLFHHPTDPENSIKEITSAVESIARTIYPGTSTLGDALKEARRKRAIPPMLLTVVDKYWAFASAEPAVRHGASIPSRIVREDAEFVFYVGIALIRYLLATENAEAEGRTSK